MTSSSTPTIQERRKDFIVYYQFCESVEQLLYKALRVRYPNMTVNDIAVCRAAYIEQITGGSPMLERRDVWALYNLPREEWSRFVLENKDKVVGSDHKPNTLEEAEELIQRNIDKNVDVEGIPLFQSDEDFKAAIDLAVERGYAEYDTRNNDQLVVLRDEIQNVLYKAIEEAVQTEEYVDDEQLFKQEQE
jgi:hypothetical protein